ncbi:MAG: hypothetical protein ABJE47_15110 [bacterium]
MDPFSYLAVLISIILGFGITQLLNGVGRLLQHRHRVRVYSPTLGWVGLLLLLHVQTWWAMFGLRSYQQWSFVAFLVVLLQPIILYLLAALALPDVSLENAGDLRANYYDHSQWFFGLAVLLLAASLTRDRVLAGHFPNQLNLSVHALLLLGWGAGAITRREWYHRLLVPYTALLMAGYIAVLFRTLP